MEANNMAALRKALIAAKGNFDSMGANALEGELNLDAVAMICASMSARMDAALSAPPRNCDVGTADEQAERFENFCLEHIGCAEETGGRHCVGCPLENASRNITQKCDLYWAQMPFAPAEGGAYETNG